MSALTNYRNSSVQAEESLFFLGITESDSEVFHMMFLRADSSTIDAGANTETINDVTQKTQAEEIASYSPTMAYSGLFLADDPVCRALESLFRNRAVGADTHFNLVEIDTWNETSTAGTYVAYKTDVSIAIGSFTNEAGGKRRIEATISYTGDPVDGTATYNADTGIATFTANT